MPRYQRGRFRVGAARWEQQRRTSNTNDTDSSSSSSSSSSISSVSDFSRSSISSRSSRNSSASAASGTLNNSNSDNNSNQRERDSDSERNRYSGDSDNNSNNHSVNLDIGFSSDAESNASSSGQSRASAPVSPVFQHTDSDSHESDRSPLHSSTRGSVSSSSNPGSASPLTLSPQGSNHSFLNAFRFSNSDEESSFRPLRLVASPTSSTNISLSPEPSPTSHRITSFFFGVPNRLRAARRGSSRPNFTHRLLDSSEDLFQNPINFTDTWNQNHPPSTWTSDVMTGPSTARNGNGGSTEATVFTFECSVCLENLDAPASIDVGPSRDGGQAAQNALNDGMPIPGPSRAARNSARGRRSQPLLTDLCLTDVVSTHCGHLYHRVCLEKWFSEQGKRTCPSCRKATPATKVIRLFPSISADANNGQPRSSNEAGPSSAAAAAPVQINVPNTANASTAVVPPVPQTGGSVSRMCGRQECLDFKVIHNTLINDFNDLQQRHGNLREENEIKEAQLRSLEEDNAKKDDEILRLKREFEETRTTRSGGTVATGAKRRRI